jgi:type I restriction enzyme, S subunit
VSINSLPFLEIFQDASGGNVKTPQSEYLASGDIPIIDQGKQLVGGYTNDSSRICKAVPPVIVFGDHTRAIKYVDFPFAMGADGVKVLKPKLAADTKYLYHVLNSLSLPSAGYSRHYKFLKEFELPLPPLPEQKRIAAILDAADALRAKRRESIKQLDALIQSTFIEMFGVPLKDQRWPLVRVSEAGRVQLGRQRSPKYQTGRYSRPYVRVANVYEDYIDLTDVKFMDFDQADFDSYRLVYGDILLNEGQSTELVGRPAIWRNDIDDCCFQNTLVRFQANREKVVPEYALGVFLYFLRSGEFAKVSSKTSSVAHLGASRFSRMQFPLPPIVLQQKFGYVTQSLRKQRELMLTHALDFECVFASLQSRAFAGEL